MANLDALKKIATLLSSRQIKFVIGGSGLSYLLGADVIVNDWDIMTDASIESVEHCLAEFKLIQKGPTPPFRSKYLIELQIDEQKIEIIGGFAIETNNSVYEFPAIGNLTRHGLPLANIDSWIRIYELLGFKDKVETLLNLKSQQRI